MSKHTVRHVVSMLGALAAIGCVDTKADPGYCATCKADTGTRMDSQVAGDGGGAMEDARLPDGALAGDGSMVDALVSMDGSAADGGGDSGSDAGESMPCEDGCGGKTPVCNTVANKCVKCTESDKGACGGGKPACHEGQCVECTGTDLGACGGSTPVCHTGTLECVQCTAEDDDACKGDTPVCKTSTNQCVQCTANDDSACDTPTSLCDVPNNDCVQCLDHDDCEDVDNARCFDKQCQPCTQDDHCAHLTDTPVCDTDAGQCVECTGTKYTQCGKNGLNQQLVCDSVKRECSETEVVGASDLCLPCVSDAHCPLGQLCALETFASTDLGYRCMWHDGSGVGGAPNGCGGARPFVKTLEDVQSIDGTTGDVCGLRVTTCQAYLHFSNPSVNCEPSPDVTEDSLCGEPGQSDAYCRYFGMSNGDNLYSCTMPCLSDFDCLSGVSCGSSTPKACNLF